MRICWCVIVVAMLADFPTTTTLGAEAQSPNVVLIYTDDQGSVDVNCYGATDLITPAMDDLASRGTRFTQFYAAAPVCSPSRAALLTGRVPQRAGVPGNVSSQLGMAGMPTTQTTIAEMLKVEIKPELPDLSQSLRALQVRMKLLDDVAPGAVEGGPAETMTE